MNIKNIKNQKLSSAIESPKKPPLFGVIFLNDDYTPMDFVENLLIQEFNMDPEMADFITWRIHTSGWSSFGSFSRDVAEAKVARVRRLSQAEGYPFSCNIQPINL
jgi:ATP-dependent Clp protease adaptor protein ClpS